MIKWWSRGESNPWPHHCERCALPTELRPHRRAISRRRGRLSSASRRALAPRSALDLAPGSGRPRRFSSGACQARRRPAEPARPVPAPFHPYPPCFPASQPLFRFRKLAAEALIFHESAWLFRPGCRYVILGGRCFSQGAGKDGCPWPKGCYTVRDHEPEPNRRRRDERRDSRRC